MKPAASIVTPAKVGVHTAMDSRLGGNDPSGQFSSCERLGGDDSNGQFSNFEFRFSELLTSDS